MRRTIPLFCAVLFLFAATGCGETPAQQKQAAQAVIDLGKIENGIYTNSFFSLSIPVPKDWYVVPNKMMEELHKKGVKIIAGDNKMREAAIEAASVVNLLEVFEKPPGTPMPFDPSFISLAEKVSALPGIQRGSDYLYQVKQQLSHSAMKPARMSEPRTVDVDGKSFDVVDADLDVGTVKIHQSYYAVVESGYALCFIISYADDAQKAKVEGIVKSVTFTNAK